ncbi:antigen 5 like allergen Cul n 1-like isoform X1 [Anopheles bellator]|uniref:antigen 5 like allergen Cul n 1-like isoform X1 n=2 Tax=Anopheles bellator TaxID=139047 RepID=UPI002649ECAC|nr:antigen 5 like allergen Cul n 1-like isoform X1 [Anopheles bellator]
MRGMNVAVYAQLLVVQWLLITGVRTSAKLDARQTTTVFYNADLATTTGEANTELSWSWDKANTRAFQQPSDVTVTHYHIDDNQERVDSAAYQYYCQPELCIRRNSVGEELVLKHVACAFNGSFSAQCPPGRMILTMDSQLRQFVVDIHNQMRDALARGADVNFSFEPASRMPTVTWDDELANLAEINIRSCKLEHDECRSTARFLQAGQNLAIGSFYIEQNIFDIVNNLTMLWFSEYKDAVQEILDHYTTEYNATIGHFTQMISDRTTAVGCGIMIYPKRTEDFVFKVILYACNYAITNIVGQSVYRKGETASRCVTGNNAKYPGLCSAEENKFIKAISAYV